MLTVSVIMLPFLLVVSIEDGAVVVVLHNREVDDLGAMALG
jgi:hypothetical protein